MKGMRPMTSKDDRGPVRGPGSAPLAFLSAVAVVLLSVTAVMKLSGCAGRSPAEAENRELRLERAALRDLKRIETIAGRSLDLHPPAPADVIVVERPQNLPKDARMAAQAARGETQQ